MNDKARIIGDLHTAEGKLVPITLGVFEDGPDDVVLHLVLHRPEHHALGGRRSDRPRANNVDKLVQKCVVDVLVDVDALARDAELARVEEGAESHLRRDNVEVNVGADDAGAVSAELEGNVLELAAGRRHDLLARCRGPGEADLLDARVVADHGTEARIAVEGLQHASREEGRHNLRKLDDAVRGKRRRLDDDDVSC